MLPPFKSAWTMFWIYQEEEWFCDHQTYYQRAQRRNMGEKQSRIVGHLYFFFVCIIITPILICGCSYFNKGFQAESAFKEANDFFSQGNYKASLSKYEQIIEKYPTEGDRVLFEMGIIYAYPGNEQKDYQKSLE
jgi:hypothetical protein